MLMFRLSVGATASSSWVVSICAHPTRALEISWHSKVKTTLVGVQERALAYCSDLGLLIKDYGFH
jgi:hypothetical protein